MYLIENPVLQRELLVNLRMVRSFVLLLVYQLLLATLVYVAWPRDTRVDPSHMDAARQLVDLFFAGQYLLASLMAPSFASAAITGEKERQTYEMLLASPLRPGAIVLGKLLASLTHLAALIVASLPIVMLSLPLGGVSLYEVLAAYLGLGVSVVTFGMISVACSSYFKRTSSSLVVSYLIILPLALLGVLAWFALADKGASVRLLATVTVLPALATIVFLLLFFNTSQRLLHPPDVGSEGKEVVDLEQEAQQAVGLVINRDQFPDKLFAPAKRDDLMPDTANPVYEREVGSEIFSQGTLMLRLVIQVSMVLALPIMAGCLYMIPKHSSWYIAYVILFNILVGPVFSAGTVTSERERETLDLLLTTIITPWQILWGKLVAGLRVSSVLTLFLVWPLVLAAVLVQDYWRNILCVPAYLAIILLTCLTTAMIALFCSVVFRKSAVSMMTSYVIIVTLFFAPPALNYFANTFFPLANAVAAERPAPAGEAAANRTSSAAPEITATPLRHAVFWTGITSPFSAARNVPFQERFSSAAGAPGDIGNPGDWLLVWGYIFFTSGLNVALLAVMIWLFNTRWRVSG